ncbi:MAG TPA: regulatory iron-sulfur-containing complex subunit RicT [Gemmatimonadaceae bacterium]|nr:regulatory iron-sulfur-containing complex subunit RicT [Gemmatimonadaceae bacterium]
MPHLIEVAFNGNRKEFFLWESDDPPAPRAAVIVEADRGEDFGRVHATGELAEKRSLGCAHGCGTSAPARKALRLATSNEVRQAEGLAKLNEEARRHASQRVRAQGLVMKVSDAEWQWDRRKLTLYFTAEHRVDFRQLVRELAAQFRTRIELKQIGVRDEAKRLDGIGRCGRQYCSAAWLPELRPVNLGVAKEQRLSLNPTQISGACGRLMCCLRYEHEVYVAARKRFPKEGKIFQTARGEEKLIAVDIFNERLTLRSVEGETRAVSLAVFQEETGLQAPIVMEPSLASEAEPEDELDSELVSESTEEETTGDSIAGMTADNGTPDAGPAQRVNRRRRGRRGGRGGRRARDRGQPEQDRRAGDDTGSPPKQTD